MIHCRSQRLAATKQPEATSVERIAIVIANGPGRFNSSNRLDHFATTSPNFPYYISMSREAFLESSSDRVKS